MEGWAKLYSRILQSSVWRESSDVRVVWITLLALKDRDGCVYGSAEWLADQARVEDEVCRKALRKFLSPDKRSRNSANDGRRIEEVEGGWRVLNHELYRDGMEEMRDKWRRQKAEQREKGKAMNTGLKGAEKQAAIDALTGKTFEPGELEKELERIHGPYDAENGMTAERRQAIMERTRAKIARLEALEAAVRAKYNPEGSGQREVREDEKGLSAVEIVRKRVEEDPITKADKEAMKGKQHEP